MRGGGSRRRATGSAPSMIYAHTLGARSAHTLGISERSARTLGSVTTPARTLRARTTMTDEAGDTESQSARALNARAPGRSGAKSTASRATLSEPASRRTIGVRKGSSDRQQGNSRPAQSSSAAPTRKIGRQRGDDGLHAYSATLMERAVKFTALSKVHWWMHSPEPTPDNKYPWKCATCGNILKSLGAVRSAAYACSAREGDHLPSQAERRNIADMNGLRRVSFPRKVIDDFLARRAWTQQGSCYANWRCEVCGWELPSGIARPAAQRRLHILRHGKGFTSEATDTETRRSFCKVANRCKTFLAEELLRIWNTSRPRFGHDLSLTTDVYDKLPPVTRKLCHCVSRISAIAVRPCSPLRA